MNYFYHLIIMFEIYLLASVSLNLMAGFTGLVSLAHAGYFAIGSYTYSILILFNWTFPEALLGVIIVSVMLSVFLSLPSLKLNGDYFVLLTIAVQSLIHSAIYNWSKMGYEIGTIQNLTNGPAGISGSSIPVIFNIKFDTYSSKLILYSFVCVLCLWLFFKVVKSPFGRSLKAIRDDELAARSLGKNTKAAKIKIIAASASFISISGAIYSSYIGFIDPTISNLDHSILILSMVIVGGLGNFRGTIIGPLVLILIPEFLRQFEIFSPIVANLRLMVYGLLMIIMLHVRPQGLAGEYRIE